MSARHPILSDEREGLLMRYSSREMYGIEPAPDDLYLRYVKGGIRFFADTRVELAIERDELLIWDNWRIIQAFDPDDVHSAAGLGVPRIVVKATAAAKSAMQAPMKAAVA